MILNVLTGRWIPFSFAKPDSSYWIICGKWVDSMACGKDWRTSSVLMPQRHFNIDPTFTHWMKISPPPTECDDQEIQLV